MHGEQAMLEALSSSSKSEARMQLRARIALLAADGTQSREIGRSDNLRCPRLIVRLPVMVSDHSGRSPSPIPAIMNTRSLLTEQT
jgi:hypothetical protein